MKVCRANGSGGHPPLDESRGESLTSPLVMCGPQDLRFNVPVELRYVMFLFAFLIFEILKVLTSLMNQIVLLLLGFTLHNYLEILNGCCYSYSLGNEWLSGKSLGCSMSKCLSSSLTYYQLLTTAGVQQVSWCASLTHQ